MLSLTTPMTPHMRNTPAFLTHNDEKGKEKAPRPTTATLAPGSTAARPVEPTFSHRCEAVPVSVPQGVEAGITLSNTTLGIQRNHFTVAGSDGPCVWGRDGDVCKDMLFQIHPNLELQRRREGDIELGADQASP